VSRAATVQSCGSQLLSCLPCRIVFEKLVPLLIPLVFLTSVNSLFYRTCTAHIFCRVVSLHFQLCDCAQAATSFAVPLPGVADRPVSIFTFTKLPEMEVIEFRSEFALNYILMKSFFTQFGSRDRSKY
jgi:hypothetical protein